MFVHMAEYCDTLQSKEKRNRENKACLNERAILRLLDHDVTWKSGCFLAPERDDFSKNSGIFNLRKRGHFGVSVRGSVRSCRLMRLVQEVSVSLHVQHRRNHLHKHDKHGELF
jgi:hypothetical protein